MDVYLTLLIPFQTILLFANYYTLFKTGRDFLVFSKLNSREEECAQELEPM